MRGYVGRARERKNPLSLRQLLVPQRVRNLDGCKELFRGTGSGAGPPGAGFCREAGSGGYGELLMARVSQQEFLKRLEKGKAIPAILLLGDEAYLRDSCRAQLIERFVPEAARVWAVSRYSADRNETQAALE